MAAMPTFLSFAGARSSKANILLQGCESLLGVCVTSCHCLLIELLGLGVVFCVLIEGADGVSYLTCVLCGRSCIEVLLEVLDGVVGLGGLLASHTCNVEGVGVL